MGDSVHVLFKYVPFSYVRIANLFSNRQICSYVFENREPVLTTSAAVDEGE